MKFTWTASDKAKLVPGASVVLHGMPHPSMNRRCVIAEVTPHNHLCLEGGELVAPLDYADPSTVELPTAVNLEPVCL